MTRETIAPPAGEPTAPANLLAAQAAGLLKISASRLSDVLRISNLVMSKSATVVQIVAFFRGDAFAETAVAADLGRRQLMLANAADTLRALAREAADASLEIRSVIGEDRQVFLSGTPVSRAAVQSMQDVHKALRLICERTTRSAHGLQSPREKIKMLEREINVMLLEIDKNEIVAASAAKAVEKYLNEIIKIVRILEQIDGCP